MKPDNHLKKILIILLTIVLLFLAIYYLLFTKIRNKNENVSRLKNELDLQSKKQQYMSSMEKIVKDAEVNINKIDNSIVASDGNVKFIEGLESRARENGLEIEISSLNFENSKAVASSTMTLFKIKAKTTGAWIGSYTFLAQLESLPFKVKIDKFALRSLSTGVPLSTTPRSANIWEGTFEISILKYK